MVIMKTKKISVSRAKLNVNIVLITPLVNLAFKYIIVNFEYDL